MYNACTHNLDRHRQLRASCSYLVHIKWIQNTTEWKAEHFLNGTDFSKTASLHPKQYHRASVKILHAAFFKEALCPALLLPLSISYSSVPPLLHSTTPLHRPIIAHPTPLTTKVPCICASFIPKTLFLSVRYTAPECTDLCWSPWQ